MAGASAASQVLRRLFLVTSPGLERGLERELQVLGVPGRFERLPGGVAAVGTAETLWRSALQSRLAELVLVRVGEPFHAPDTRSLDEGLRRLPWQDYLTEEAPESVPIIKVSTEKSRLYHTKLLENHTAQSIRAARLPPRPFAQADKAAPEVRVRLRHNQCQVSVAATGLMHKRGARKAVGEASLRETLAAACVLASPLLRRLTAAQHNDEELVLWDPFCGSGAVLLEALEIALGEICGNVERHYPFMSFPCHDHEDFQRFAETLQPRPHAAVSKLTLIGSDASEEQLERCKRNLRRCLRRLAILQEKAPELPELLEKLPCKVQLLRAPVSRAVQQLQG
ncbi:unnamed protein product, partial [Effrenium voratum]